MARSRNIKPGFFTNDVLGELPALTRLFFAGMWTLCDREGRLEDRPKKIKAEILPYDVCDADQMLAALEKNGFIQRYEARGIKVIQVVAWGKHQNPHVKEAPSVLPAPNQNSLSTIQAPDLAQPLPERAGLIPDSLLLIPDSLGGNAHEAKTVDNFEPPGFPPPIPEKFRDALQTRPELDGATVYANFAGHFSEEKRTLARWQKWVQSENPPKFATAGSGQNRITVPGPPGRDPELLRMDVEANLRKPMPPEIRSRFRELLAEKGIKTRSSQPA